MEKKKNIQLVSIDWLELYGHLLDEDAIQGTKGTYTCGRFKIELQENGTKNFENLYFITLDGLKVATMLTKPRAKFIHKRSCNLKIENRVLYSMDWYDMTAELVKELRMKYKSITRADLCCDFKRFANDQRPHAFIKRYVNSTYGQDGYLYRKGSNKFSVQGDKGKGGISKMSYIAFGSNNSAVRAYIYNKSKELREVKQKPWITDFWEKNGLKADEKNDIWRAEIRIRAKGAMALNFETGELFQIAPRYLKLQEKLEQIFLAFAEKYFCFKEQNGQKEAKDFRPVKLFELEKTAPIRAKYWCRKIDAGRSEKMIVNKLKKYQETYQDLEQEQLDTFARTIALIEFLGNLKDERYRKREQEEYAEAMIRHMRAREKMIS